MAITIRSWGLVFWFGVASCLLATPSSMDIKQDPNKRKLTAGVSDGEPLPPEFVKLLAKDVQTGPTLPQSPQSLLLSRLEEVCVNPLFVSVAPIGSRGVTISGTPGCTYTLRLKNVAQHQPDIFQILINPNGMGFLDIEIPSQAVMDLGRHAMHSISDSFETVPTRSEWALTLLIIGIGVFGLFLSRRVTFGSATLVNLNRTKRSKSAA